ncbi:MAG: hypothetical protein ABSG04_06525, partial [Verrucomicrobiota bacterium]
MPIPRTDPSISILEVPPEKGCVVKPGIGQPVGLRFVFNGVAIMVTMDNKKLVDRRMHVAVNYYLVPRTDINMRVPDEIKKCVVFFVMPIPVAGGVVLEYKATGFFVAVKLDGLFFVYLVTAKHVAEKLEGREFGIRVNTRDGKSTIYRAPPGANLPWHYHPTDAVADVAVWSWTPGPEADCLHVDSETIFTKEVCSKIGLGIGDEVCMVGLFSFHEGQSRNHPILRIGNIAMLPDERIKTSMGEMEAYLIEARSIGGLSGSPVFVCNQYQKADMKFSFNWGL